MWNNSFYMCKSFIRKKRNICKKRKWYLTLAFLTNYIFIFHMKINFISIIYIYIHSLFFFCICYRYICFNKYILHFLLLINNRSFYGMNVVFKLIYYHILPLQRLWYIDSVDRTLMLRWMGWQRSCHPRHFTGINYWYRTAVLSCERGFTFLRYM